MIDCYLCTKNGCVKGEHYTGIWGLEQTILSKSWGNLIYLERVNDSSRNFSSLVSSGCKNVSNSSFANSFSSSDGMCHWMLRLKRSPGFPQSYTWRKKYKLFLLQYQKSVLSLTWLFVCTWLFQRDQQRNRKMIGRLISVRRRSYNDLKDL